jgi:nitrate/nitrite transporter NarK
MAAWLFARESVVSEGLVTVIRFYASLPLVAAVCVLLFVPGDSPQASGDGHRIARTHLPAILTMPVVWILGLIIFLAYWVYVGTFEFATYGERAFAQDKVFGAQLGAFKEWLRPVAAIGAGLLADRIRPTRAVTAAFLVCACGYAGLALLPGSAGWLWALWTQVAAIAIAVFALRGIYFALLEESGVPLVMTGTAVGVVSTIGFLPDVFAYPLAGWFVDTFGAEAGYTRYFTLLAGAAVAGAGLALALGRMVHASDGSGSTGARAADRC